MVSFWESVKKFKMSRQRWSMQAFRPVTLLKETPTQVFSCEYCEIFRNAFFTEHLQETASESWIWKHFLVVTDVFFVRRIPKQLLWRLTQTCFRDCYQLDVDVLNVLSSKLYAVPLDLFHSNGIVRHTAKSNEIEIKRYSLHARYHLYGESRSWYNLY